MEYNPIPYSLFFYRGWRSVRPRARRRYMLYLAPSWPATGRPDQGCCWWHVGGGEGGRGIQGRLPSALGWRARANQGGMGSQISRPFPRFPRPLSTASATLLTTRHSVTYSVAREVRGALRQPFNLRGNATSSRRAFTAAFTLTAPVGLEERSLGPHDSGRPDDSPAS